MTKSMWTVRCVRKPGTQQPLQFIPNLNSGVEVRVLCGPQSYSKTTLANDVLMDLTLSAVTLSCWKWFG